MPKHLKHLFELRLREAKRDEDKYILDDIKREKAQNRVKYWSIKLNRLNRLNSQYVDA